MTKKALPFLGLAVVTVLALATAQPVRADWYVNSLGWLVYESDGNVLGEETIVDSLKVERKLETKTENREQKREVEYFDANRKTWVKAKTEPGKTKTEIKSLTGEEITTETEREKYKLKLKPEAGILKLEAETETGETTELGEDDEIEIEARHDDKIRVATGSSDREMTFSRNRVRARTNFPLSVDLNTNELIVTTPNGVKRVTVLPDQAIAKLLENNVLDRLEPDSEEELELTEEDGVPSYEVAGESDQKLLGFMPVKIKSRVKVSAETGEVIRTEKTIRDRLFDFLSF